MCDLGDESSFSRDYSFNIKDDICVQMGGVNFKQKFKLNIEINSSTNNYNRIFLPFTLFQAEFRGRSVTRSAINTRFIKEVSFMAMKPAGSFKLYIHKIGVYKKLE